VQGKIQRRKILKWRLVLFGEPRVTACLVLFFSFELGGILARGLPEIFLWFAKAPYTVPLDAEHLLSAAGITGQKYKRPLAIDGVHQNKERDI
jgi:hypothetical protein